MRRKEGRRNTTWSKVICDNIPFLLLKGVSFLLFYIPLGGEKMRKGGDINKSSLYILLCEMRKRRG